MQIQLNSDNRIVASPALLARVQADLEQELKHVASAITRVEVHLNDVNGPRGGEDDKRCLLEARIKGSQPVAVESRAPTIEQAITAAAGQLHRAIKTTLGKSGGAEKRHASIRHSPPEEPET
ncbi:HPF/RaiA family ribosome-associated protein [Massilia sp. CCM 9210]|nr:HPF/RaiA family ribosome-associated protein [Massilia sp. CCM 9210]MDQ1813874.1 HPF/RaiA family ribosome-associated protein [Massilia sp. CCM 9210]